MQLNTYLKNLGYNSIHEQHKFMIKFGFLTQIIDDICDLQNDINSNCNTYYVRMVQKYNKMHQNTVHLQYRHFWGLQKSGASSNIVKVFVRASREFD